MVEWLYEHLGQVRCHATRSLIDKTDNSQHAQPHRYELTHTPDTHVHPVYPVLYSFSDIAFPFSNHSHHFKEIILAKQGSIIAIKGPTIFLQQNNMQFIKRVIGLCL
jgi:hypothetical protein